MAISCKLPQLHCKCTVYKSYGVTKLKQSVKFAEGRQVSYRNTDMTVVKIQ